MSRQFSLLLSAAAGFCNPPHSELAATAAGVLHAPAVLRAQGASIKIGARPAVFDGNIFTVNISSCFQALPERIRIARERIR